MRRWKHLVLAAALVTAPALVAYADQEKDEKGKDKGAQAADDAKGRLASIDRRIQDEADKHARRLARIDRVADLARGKKDDKAKADADKLREIENERHKKAMERLTAEREAAASGKPAKDEKGKPDDKGGKPEDKGAGKPEDKGTGTDKPADKPEDKGEGKKPEDDKGEKPNDGDKEKKEKEEKDEKDKGKSGEDHGKDKK